MNKKLVIRTLYIFLSIFILYKIGAYFGINKIKEILLAKNIKHDAVSINFFTGDFILTNVETTLDSLHVKAEELEVKTLSYYHFFKNDAFHISDFIVKNASVIGQINSKKKATQETKKDKDNKQKELPKIIIKNIYFDAIKIDLGKGGLQHTIESLTLKVADFDYDTSKNSAFPFTYSNIEASIKNLESQYSKVQKIGFSNLSFKENNIILDSLEIVPLKPKENYIYHVDKRKELLTLAVHQLQINNINFTDDEKFSVVTDDILVDKPNLEMYLDATFFKSPTKTKNYYSKILRDLSFFIDVKKITIQNGSLAYKELNKKDKGVGVLTFDALNAEIKNVNNNINRAEKLTTVAVNTKFMNSSPLKVDWNFDILNKSDAYNIAGTLKNVTSKNMSSFLLPTMNVQMDGFINDMEFDFKGNNKVAGGTFGLDFKNLKVEIFDKNKNDKAVLNFVANMFIKSSSKNGIVKVEIEEVKRDETKSFWNNFWQIIKKGLIKSLV